MAFKLHHDGDLARKVLTQIGVYNKKEKEPLVFKYSALNKKAPHGINHHISQHSMSLQRSRYLCVDDNTSKKFVVENENKKILMNKQKKLTQEIYHDIRLQNICDGKADAFDFTKYYKNNNQFDLNLRYCPEREVNAKQAAFMNLKFKFSAKLKNLKLNGKKILIQDRIRFWILANIDWLFKNPVLREKFCKVKEKSRSIHILLGNKSEDYRMGAFVDNLMLHIENKMLEKRRRVR